MISLLSLEILSKRLTEERLQRILDFDRLGMKIIVRYIEEQNNTGLYSIMVMTPKCERAIPSGFKKDLNECADICIEWINKFILNEKTINYYIGNTVLQKTSDTTTATTYGRKVWNMGKE